MVRDQRRLHGPKGERSHKSDRAKVTREKKEKLKAEDEDENGCRRNTRREC